MTNEEKIRRRMESVRHLFHLTGEDFVREVLSSHRSEDAAPPEDIRKRYDVSDHTLCGRRWYKIKALGAMPQGQTEKILYLHGGAFVLESGVAEFLYAGYLSEQTGAEVWFPEYHLVPEHNCLEALEMVLKLYKIMLQETPNHAIAMMGASAGGGVAVSSAMYFRENGLPQPNSLTLYSPAVEFCMPETKEDQEYLALLEQRDPTISYCCMPTIAALWRGDLSQDDYRANPIAGNLQNLAPILFFSGTGEVLNLAARHFIKQARTQQIKLRYIEKEMKPHCWVLFPGEEVEEDRRIVVETLLRPPV